MKIFISSCQPFKSGTKNGRNWTLYTITDPKGVRYSTFEAKYVGMVGQEIESEVEEKPSDKINPQTNQPYINRTIIEPKRGSGETTSGFTASKLNAMDKKLDEILELLYGITEPTSDVDIAPQDDITAEKLPF